MAVFCLSAPPLQATPRCQNEFKSQAQVLATASERAAPLNPELSQAIGNSASLFEATLILKRFEYRFSDDYTMIGRGKELLNQLEIQALHDRNQSAFDLSKANPEEATQFIANGARQIYVWLADRIRAELLSSATNSRELKNENSQILEHLFERSVNLNWSDRNTTPGELEHSFADAKWKTVPWAELVSHLEDGAPISEELAREIERARQVIGLKKDPLCCMTEPGCRTCPLNRRFRN